MSKHLFPRIAGVAVAATALLSVFAGPASASTTPPSPNPALVGTWVNTNSATRSVTQIVVQPATDRGGLTVDAFGACTPTACEWGRVPAIVYGPNVSAKTGAMFQTDQAFVINQTEWSRTQLQATLTVASSGSKTLRVRELTAFEDGSGRHNYTVTESFVPGKGLAPTINGINASGYVFGFPPSAVAGLAGDWKAPGSGVIEIKIAISGGTPVVDAFGACSPTPCDLGTVRGVTYGTSISSSSGRVVLAPYSFGFKNEQLVMTFVPGATAANDRLVVQNYNEFTDGSGRSNYALSTTFTRA